MKLGIVSDIHEAVELLAQALVLLDHEGVDRVIVLGDVFETGVRMEETIDLLGNARAFGVYGNHDFGLSNDPSDYILSRFSPRVVGYMKTLLPRMEVDGAFFAHREPYLDCSIVTEIWDMDEETPSPLAIQKSFASVSNPSIFIGHYHQWLAYQVDGRLDWDGSKPLALSVERPTLVIIAAVCDGHAATFDTVTRLLTPVDLYLGGTRPTSRPLPRLVLE